MLHLYRKMDSISTYVRRYLINILFLTLVLSCASTIWVYGSEDIFPTSTTKVKGVYEGSERDWFKPNSRTYFDKIVLSTGIPYLILFILTILLYVFLNFAHTKCVIFRPFKLLALNELNLIPSNLTHEGVMLLNPDGYDPKSMPKYAEPLQALEKKLHNTHPDLEHQDQADVYKINEIIHSRFDDQDHTERRMNIQGKCIQVLMYLI